MLSAMCCILLHVGEKFVAHTGRKATTYLRARSMLDVCDLRERLGLTGILGLNVALEFMRKNL